MNTDIPQPTWTTDLRAPRGLWLLLVALPLLSIAAFLMYTSWQTLPRIALAPAFDLLDQDGNRLTNEDLRGKLVIYHFADNNLAENNLANDSVESINAPLQAAQSEFDTGDIPLHIVTVATSASLPKSLHAEADMRGASAVKWHFVSGDAELFTAFRQTNDQQVTGYILVDGWGIVRALYPQNAPDLVAIQRDVRLVAQEAQQSRGVNRVGYETVHLFMCHNGL